MLDINGGELLIIALLAALVVGPERIPEYARTLRAAVRRLRDFMRDTEASVRRELGPEADLASLDPRRYDPRRIVREALGDDLSDADDPRAAQGPRRIRPLTKGQQAPYDVDAT